MFEIFASYRNLKKLEIFGEHFFILMKRVRLFTAGNHIPYPYFAFPVYKIYTFKLE